MVFVLTPEIFVLAPRLWRFVVLVADSPFVASQLSSALKSTCGDVYVLTGQATKSEDAGITIVRTVSAATHSVRPVV